MTNTTTGLMTATPGSVPAAVDQAAVSCIRCGTDRHQHVGKGDPCATACWAAAAVLLVSDWDRLAKTPATLKRCAAACEAVAANQGELSAAEYAECSRRCRQLLDVLALEQATAGVR